MCVEMTKSKTMSVVFSMSFTMSLINKVEMQGIVKQKEDFSRIGILFDYSGDHLSFKLASLLLSF